MPQPTLLMRRRAPGSGPLVLVVLLAGLMLLLLPPAGGRADSFTVTNPGDPYKEGLPRNCTGQRSKTYCSLRDAITASNQNGQWNNIYLPKGDYKLNGALPPITSAMMIQGERADLTVIFGRHEIGDRFPVFYVCGSRVDSYCPSKRPGNLSLHEVTIREGGSDDPGKGGGLHNAGVLEVHNSIIEDNIANLNGAGIFNSARLSLYNTTVRNNNRRDGLASNNASRRGGLYNAPSGDAKITGSTISGNAADFGGGIMNEGLIEIVNSTISSNQATADNDRDSPNAGGILNQGEAWLNNVTIAANSTVALAQKAPFSGGVSNTGDFLFANTIVAGNTIGAKRLLLFPLAANQTDLNFVWTGTPLDCAGMLVTKGGNLVADLGRVTGFDAKGVAERDCEIVPPSTWPANAPPRKRDVKVVDMRDVLVVAPQDPMDKDSFAPQLADNGGPTKTHALCTGRQRGDFFLDVFWDFCIKGSLARDQAWPTPNDPHNPYACEALDQRGARRADGLCDIGAYEAP